MSDKDLPCFMASSGHNKNSPADGGQSIKWTISEVFLNILVRERPIIRTDLQIRIVVAPHAIFHRIEEGYLLNN